METFVWLLLLLGCFDWSSCSGGHEHVSINELVKTRWLRCDLTLMLYLQMRYIVETQGHPSDTLLTPGLKTGCFFQYNGNSMNRIWKLKVPVTSPRLWPWWLSLCPINSVYVVFLTYCRICGSVCLFVHVYCTQNVISNNNTISSDTWPDLLWDRDSVEREQV